MFLPARAWLVDEHDRIIVDFIGKLETIATDWARIQALTGSQAALPQANTTSESRSAAEDLSPASLDILSAYFDADFGTFDYSRQGAAAARRPFHCPKARGRLWRKAGTGPRGKRR